MVDLSSRTALILEAAAEWRDRRTAVRVEADAALRGGPWSPAVVEAALDDVLHDLDRSSLEAIGAQVARYRPASGSLDDRPVLVVLPGNIVGPAIHSAFCAATTGSRAILKSATSERVLASIVARQFERLGPPLAGSVEARYWPGGDSAVEAPLFEGLSGIIVFGSDATVDDVRARAPQLPCRAYGDSHSIGVVMAPADVTRAARAAARDICMFDQAGCMSPQTIYLQGDESRALLFAQALFAAMSVTAGTLPQVRAGSEEAAAVAARIRDLAVTVQTPKTHGLDTLIVGPKRDGAPDFVIAVEPFGSPSIHGSGRIVSVKPFDDPTMLKRALAEHRGELDTVGVAGEITPALQTAFGERFKRLCALGEMQRPPFGYRPAPTDFLDVRSRAKLS